ncbi:hypothetical protein P4O66_012753 [Electrophorus voltai]|uniref:B30.2/SPRY domain-containing protein n=1 Tax=Electrophorus voltai TaxID=2609070 RepID=A0AAD8Z5B2_9TELE|nr:hypothetical protein P4O66_012753 [Electrophorus voltai]
MEIRWYRPDQYSTPVLLYLNHKVMTDLQKERYRNRTSLSLREENSAGLKGGDVSLELKNLNMGDRGMFHCFVSGDKAYGSCTLALNLTALGSSPVLSLQPQGDQVNVTCRSCGWLPKPRVEWKLSEQKIPGPGGLLFSQEGELTCVQSWVLLSPSRSGPISCSISLPGGEEKDGHVDIQNILCLKHGGGPWKAISAVSTLAAVALAAISIYFYRKYKTGYTAVKKGQEAEETAYPNPNMEELRKAAVSITLDDRRTCPGLMVKNKLVRDKEGVADTHREPGFPYHLSVYGRNSFSSGRAYWEVGLISPNIQPKTSWLIGVTKASNDFTENKHDDMTPSKGFWFLYLSKQTGLRVNTEPEISLPLVSRPESVGVLLDYDQGELSFYNVKEGICLVTMKTKFQGQVLPMFNPGIGDEAPLKILDTAGPSAVPAEGASSPTDNSVKIP